MIVVKITAVKIGRRSYKIKHEYLPQDYGRVDLAKGIIRIDDPQPPFVVADATLHEILHAVWAERGLPDRAREERTVTALAQGLTAVFRDNPGLLQYLDRLVSEER